MSILNTKIFLMGQCRTNWRDEIIKNFPEINFFNPKKKGWTKEDIYNELAEIVNSNLVIALNDGLNGKGTDDEILFIYKIQQSLKLKVFKSVEEIIKFLNEYKEKINI